MAKGYSEGVPTNIKDMLYNFDGDTLHGAKVDHRKPRGGWADGNYMNTCFNCEDKFFGDKRAVQCADCAYNQSREPVSLKRIVGWRLIIGLIILALIAWYGIEVKIGESTFWINPLF